MFPMDQAEGPQGGPGGLPPELLMQLLGGGAGAGGPMGGPMGPDIDPEFLAGFQDAMNDPDDDEEEEEEQPEMSPVEHLRQAIEHAQAALVGEPDDADSQVLAKVVQGLYQILAQRQKEEQQVMGNPATQRVVARSAQ